jgi:tetratricopeptide (TPR) repeat protein
VLSAVPDTGRSAKLYAALGQTYEQRKEFKNAIDAFKKAIMLDRDNLDAIRGLAENLLNDGQTTPPSNNTKSSPTRIRKTRKPSCASPKFIAARASTTRLSRTSRKPTPWFPIPSKSPTTWPVVYEAQGRYDDAVKFCRIW